MLVSLTEERAIYLALELDRSWTETDGKVVGRAVQVKCEWLHVMISRLALWSIQGPVLLGTPLRLNVVHWDMLRDLLVCHSFHRCS
jgi:hypothetical protein